MKSCGRKNHNVVRHTNFFFVICHVSVVSSLQDHWIRWAGWITFASITVILGITTIGLVGSG